MELLTQSARQIAAKYLPLCGCCKLSVERGDLLQHQTPCGSKQEAFISEMIQYRRFWMDQVRKEFTLSETE